LSVTGDTDLVREQSVIFVPELNLIMMILSTFRKLYTFRAKLMQLKKLITCKRMLAVYAGTMQVNGMMDPAVKTTSKQVF